MLRLIPQMYTKVLNSIHLGISGLQSVGYENFIISLENHLFIHK